MLAIIDQFLEKKSLSENSYQSYRYDLVQFINLLNASFPEINQTLIAVTQQKYNELNLSAKTFHRKASIINQFLAYLYSNEFINELVEIKVKPLSMASTKNNQLINFEKLYEDEIELSVLLVIFILETGMNIQDVLLIKSEAVNLDYDFIQAVVKKQTKVIPITAQLKKYLTSYSFGKVYLFEHQGKAFSRQWGHLTVKRTLNHFGFEDLTPAKLREQYILKEISLGKSIHQLKEQLGLSTLVTLEPYFRGVSND